MIPGALAEVKMGLEPEKMEVIIGDERRLSVLEKNNKAAFTFLSNEQEKKKKRPP